MQVRLMGTQTECQELTVHVRTRLAEVVQVVGVSRFYPNRGESDLGRVFLEVRPVAETPAPAPASRRSVTTRTKTASTATRTRTTDSRNGTQGGTR